VKREHELKDWVALILALSICIALNLMVAGILYNAIVHSHVPLSENATQVLTGAIGGIIGILGSYLGFREGERSALDQPGLSVVRSEPTPEAPDTDELEHP